MGLHSSLLRFNLLISSYKPNRHNPQKLNMPKGSGLTKPMKLSAELADIVVKKNNLQDPENKQFFNPDKKMAKIFGNDRIRAFGMAKEPLRHLGVPSPVLK